MSAPNGTEAAWWRHVLYGLAGETFEAQAALDRLEAAVEARTLREAAAKIRHHIGGDSYAADLIDPDKED